MSGARPSETGSRASTGPVSRPGPTGFDPARMAANLSDEMLFDLRNVAEGKPTVPGFGNPVWHLKCLGYVEERTIHKPCRTCGSPQVDYRYDKITALGRAILSAASGMKAATAGSTEGDSPAPHSGETPK